MPHPAAILTGDIVASRKAGTGALDAALTTLGDAATEFGRDRELDLRFTRFRGDGWQAMLTDPAQILDATLYLIARLRAADTGLDTRLAVGIGAVDSPGTRDLSDATGPAFFTSGDHLDQMPKRRRLAIAGHGIGIWQVAVFDLVEQLALDWSAAQAEVVALSLHTDPATQQDLADRLGVTRQAVQSRLAGADLWALDNALTAFRTQGGPA